MNNKISERKIEMPFGYLRVEANNEEYLGNRVLGEAKYSCKFADDCFTICLNNEFDSKKYNSYRQEMLAKGIYLGHNIGLPARMMMNNNNAGIGIFRKVEELSFDDWNNVLTLNLTIPFIMVKNILPSMKIKNFDRIVNISSDADYRGFSEGSAYCASKFGLRGFSDSVRDELKGFNISITTISLGRVDTFFNGNKPGDRPNSLSADDVARQIMHVIEQRDICGIERIYVKSTLE